MNKLSIIVPVYNDEKNIKNCLNSLINQTTEVDIIVVDDGSTDNTYSVVKDLASKNINIKYFAKENKGIACARNFGVDKVQTEYFGFLDSDDTCKNEMAEKMLYEIEKQNADICFSNFTWVYENGKRKESKDVFYLDKKDIFSKMFATLWNKIYRTSWFKETNIKFPDGYRYEDASVLYRLVPHMDKVCYVDEVFVDYYQRKGSITHTFNVNINDMIYVFKGIIDYYKDKDLYDEYKDELEYVSTRFFLGNSYLRACRINDKNLRNETLEKGWNFLTNNFSSFKNNKYLDLPGKKNTYFKQISSKKYFSNVKWFRLLYKMHLLS